MTDSMEVITFVTYLLFLYLTLALFVERTVEVFVAIFTYAELKWNLRSIWNTAAETYRAQLDKLYGYAGEGSTGAQKLMGWVLWKVIAEKPYEGGKEMVSAGLIRLNYIRIGTRTLSFILAAIIVRTQWTYLDFLAFVPLIETLVPGGLPDFVKPLLNGLLASDTVRFVIVAAAISIGSEPLHELIGTVEKATQKKKEDA